ncbi:tyrosine-type recombinase/integrase [Nocardioides sp.]|uniref:tyrosine-type recombinase/integrase n=1 Tax=Nocardioides sp. TaxID=35761 RepID=UPI003783A6A3
MPEQAVPPTTDSTPRLVLVEGDPDRYRDALGRERRRRRTRVGHSRPGLPADPSNPWHLSVNVWAEHLRAQANTTGRYQRGLVSETERANYLKRVGWLAGDHVDRSPWSLTADDLARWIERQAWSLNTRRHVVVAVRAFYAWAVRAGLCAQSPLAGVSVTAPQAPGPDRDVLPPAWRQPMTDWQTWLRGAARTEATIRTRREHLSNLASLHSDPWTVTEGDLSRWLSRSDWSPATKRTKRASARSFYSWAVRAGHLGSDPAADLDPIRQRRALPRPTPTDVLRTAVDGADDRVRLALYLALYAGLRRAEVAGLHTRDIGERALTVRGKGGHERLVPLHPILAAELHAEIDRRRAGTDLGNGWGLSVPDPDGWLFPAGDGDRHLTPKWLGVLIGRSLGPGWTAHTIRHRFATQAYQTQRDLRAVQELLGHSKPETTARYAAVPDGALAAAVQGVEL